MPGTRRTSSRIRKNVSDHDNEEEKKKKSLEEEKKSSSQTTTKTKANNNNKKRLASSSSKSILKKTKRSDDNLAQKDKSEKKKEEKTSSDETKTAMTTKKKKTSSHQVITDRDAISKLWNKKEMTKKNGSYTFKIVSWNVAGLRGLIKNHPNALSELVKKHDIDMLCLQETKLQEIHLHDKKFGYLKDTLLAEEGYTSYYNCSTTKKGYSGTAIFIKNYGKNEKKNKTNLTNFFAVTNKKKSESKKKAIEDEDIEKTKVGEDIIKISNKIDDNNKEQQLSLLQKQLIPTTVSYKMNIAKHDTEGRLICIRLPLFTVINLYVPNSGQKLERLDYRTKEWDKDLIKFVSEEKIRGTPVIWLGDLNVAHTNLEVWNDGAKHLSKQAGVTSQERDSFTQQLTETSFIDTFKYLHNSKIKGHYSYWSQRAGNRIPNKGLRLDYFICDPILFDRDNDQKEGRKIFVRDSYMIYDQMGSDHCPVVLELEIKKN